MLIYLCDDEKNETDRMREIITDYAERFDRDLTVLCFQNTDALLKAPKADIYFLDYFMPQITGVGLAQKLFDLYGDTFTLCFLTNYDNAAIEVINSRIKAAAFLVKPAKQEEVKQLLNDLLKTPFVKQLVLKSGKEFKVVYPQEIFYIEAMQRQAEIHFLKKTESFDCKISELEENILPKSLFFRVHRCYIVNMQHIEAFDSKEIRLTNGELVPLKNPKEFKQSYQKFRLGML